VSGRVVRAGVDEREERREGYFKEENGLSPEERSTCLGRGLGLMAWLPVPVARSPLALTPPASAMLGLDLERAVATLPPRARAVLVLHDIGPRRCKH